MALNELQLYELLTPFFLAGFRFTDEADSFLRFLAIDELHMTSDESAIGYIGRVKFVEVGGQNPTRSYTPPGGGLLEWDDFYLAFRLTVPRDGAAFIDTAVNSPGLTALNTLFDDLGPVEGTLSVPTEYPGVRFRLELLFSMISFNLGEDWLPGMVEPATRRIVPDREATSQRVKFVLPKMVFEYEQGDDLSVPPAFRLKSWGSGGFDAPADVEQGEIIRMEPAIAVHTAGRYAFGVDQILIDLSEESTPPEIMEQFGTDEAFEGLFLRSLRFYYTDEKKEWGFAIAVNDALISFKGEVSFEAALDLFLPRPGINLTVTFYVDGLRRIHSRETLTSGISRDIPLFDNNDESVAHILIDGGYPPYTQTVELQPTDQSGTPTGGAAIALSQAPNRPGEWIITQPPSTGHPDGYYQLHIQVTDNAPGTPNTATRDMLIRMSTFPTGSPRPGDDGAPADRPATSVAATYTPPADGSIRSGYRLVHEGPGGGDTERLRIIGGAATVRTGGQDIPVDANGLALVPVPPGQTVIVTVTFPAVSGVAMNFPGHVLFLVNRPLISGDDVARYVRLEPSAVANSGYDNQFKNDIHRLIPWLQANNITAVTLSGYASYEHDGNAPSDQALSERRIDVVRQIIARDVPTVAITTNPGDGHAEARQEWVDNRHSDAYQGQAEDRRVEVVGTSAGVPESSTTLTFARPGGTTGGGTGGGIPSSSGRNPERPQAPAPQPPPDRAPAWMRRLGVRVRFERNVPVLFELSGQIDFDTEMEAYRRRLIANGTLPNTPPPAGQETALALQSRPSATAEANPDDGVVDFVINVTYDTATHMLAETLTLGAVPNDRDGLVQGNYDTASGVGWNDIVGALLVFAPIINAAGDHIDNEGTEGDVALLAVSIAIPVGIAALDIFRTKRITLYGGELRLRQFLGNGSEPPAFTDAAIVFDYSVEVMITLRSIGITWDAPVKVRYKAIGFSLAFNQPDVYQPIFDTSKGYELNLGDPGRASLPVPLNQILSIFAARVARVNPVTFEIEVGMKANLGIITVDRFKIRVSFENPAQISIQAAGVRVEIPSTVSGSGYVEIVDRAGDDGTIQKGFAGSIDITIIPVKLRVAASLAVIAMEDPDNGRRAIAVYFGLTVEFPAPIVLGSTGIGIYGFTGLFAMHYRRTENPPVPGAAVSPALEWLIRAGGEPAQLTRTDPVTGTRVILWEPKFDRWSFGVGIILGTVEGGFLINFRGMFVLELPGPRILIFVKIQIIAKLPAMKPATTLNVGILGVIDLDFNLGQITVGVIIDLEIRDIIQIRIPIEIFFSLRDPRNWHLFIGTIDQPVSALILNIVRANGYFMVAGNGILNFRLPDGTPRPLPGLAVAVGLGAAIIFGSESIGLYLKVAARADMGVSFLPEKLFIVGGIQLLGELRLFIVSISAEGTLIVEASETNAYIHGSICGRVSFFFFSIEGCVGVTIGTQDSSFPAPDLVKKVYLQSFAPVVVAGQGGDRPIDGSLGDAHTVLERRADGTRRVLTPEGEIILAADGTAAAADRSKVLAVPIDSVIVIQFGIVPLVSGWAAPDFFTTSPGTPPSTPGGWVSLGNERFVRYTLRAITLSPVLPAAGDTPPAVWRREHFPTPPTPPSDPPSEGADTQINLALMSRIPVTGARAVERSTDLDRQVKGRWSRACTPVAPAVCVLWTFCEQPFGPSGVGWNLRNGVPEPDPPGTQRNAPPPTHLDVEEPLWSGADHLANSLALEHGLPFDIPAQIVGYNPSSESSEIACIDFSGRLGEKLPNPYTELDVHFTVRDHTGQAVSSIRVVDFGAVGMDVSFATEIEVPVADYVALTLITGAGHFRAELYDASGNLLAEQENIAAGPELLEFSIPGISRVIVIANNNETALLSFCYEWQGASSQSGPICLDFIRLPAGKVVNPFEKNGVRLTRLQRDGTPFDANLITKFNGQAALVASDGWEIMLPPASAVEFVMLVSQRLTMKAFDAAGNTVDGLTGHANNAVQTLRLQGEGITLVQIDSRAAQMPTLLLRLCYESQPQSDEEEGTSNDDVTCMRALQLPAIRQPARGNVPIEGEIEAYIKERLGQRWVTFHTGEIVSGFFLFAVSREVLERLMVAELESDGSVITETNLGALSNTTINSIADLPAAWRDPARPWRSKIEPVLALFARAEYAALLVLLVEVQPAPNCRKIQLRFAQHDRAGDVPGVLVGAVELCTKAEEERARYDEEIRRNEIRTIRDYLNGGDVVPLLEKNRDYVLTIRYDAQVKVGTEERPVEAKVQEFYFRTDDRAPARLDNYVLGHIPDENEAFHFYRDPLKVIFNDLSVIQLYDAYGWQLRTVVRSADGNPVGYRDPATGLPSPHHHSDITTLDAVEAVYHSPYRDTLIDVIENQGLIPCVPGEGAISEAFHGSYTVPVDLRPYQSYTLDIELIDKATGNPPTNTATPGQPTAPLFRRRFRTSRYASLAELCEALQNQRVRHRALTAAINLVGAAEPLLNCEVATDEQIQAALAAAGEEVLPAAEEIGFTIYWTIRPGESRYSPHAILLDAPEPLWRYRDEPLLQTVPHQNDPNFKMVVPGQTPALRIALATGNARFVCSTGGTRTVAFLSSSFSGGTLAFVLQRDDSQLFQVVPASEPLLTLTLGTTAPWEEDVDG